MEQSKEGEITPESAPAEPQVLSIQAAGLNHVFAMPNRQAVRDTARKLLSEKFLELENDAVYLLVTINGTAIVGMPQSAYMAQQQQHQEPARPRAAQTAAVRGHGPRIVAP